MFPKLRPLNLRWVQWEGQPVLLLQDPLRLAEDVVMMPQTVAPILPLLDGTRDLEALRISFLLRTGVHFPLEQLESLLQRLDESFLLDNGRFNKAVAEAVQRYRSRPFRAPALAGEAYPEDPDELLSSLDEYCQLAGTIDQGPSEAITGVISPHIDFARGWRTYAETWQRAREGVEMADLVILLGTDHCGSPGALTLTKQDYATPWGVLPTDTQLVDRLSRILGAERAFSEEVHHVGEHSIELAAVWLHYISGGRPKRLLPVLCGPVDAQAESEDGRVGPLWEALSLLAEVAAEPAVLVVAAGDVSHVGPAFGDPLPVDPSGKARIRSLDEQWMEAACTGDAGRLKDHMLRHGDPTRICGASPIHYMITVLRKARGQVVAYDQCPADEQFGSLVSIAGALFTG